MHATKESIFSNRLLENLRSAEIAYTLTQARKIVVRISPLVYGKLSIRQFRRDLYTGVLDPYLTSKDRAILDEAHGLEEIVLEQYAPLINQLAWEYSRTTKVELDDLFQEGSQSVILAMYGYDGQTNMITYFRHVIERRMIDIFHHNKRRPSHLNLLDEEINVVAPEPEDKEEVGDVNLVWQAVALAQKEFTPLERAVMELYPYEGHGCLSKAARQVINPRTLKPFTRAAAGRSLKNALAKVARAYDNLVRNSHRRVA